MLSLGEAPNETGRSLFLIVPTLCVGMHPVTLCVTRARNSISVPMAAAHGAGPERGHAEPGRGIERKG
jgi:hypothetical protein